MAASKKEPTLSNVGERIQKARKELEISQDELGDATGLGQPQVSRIERGERGIESAKLIKLLQELRRRGVNVDYILSGTEPVLLGSDANILSELRLLLSRHQVSPDERALPGKAPGTGQNRDKP
jgi:transcriptional regulator with XRE-family HTH domain